MMPFSSGSRHTFRTWRRHSGHASKQSTPWCASDTSPGIGTWPPPISPASEMGWWGARHGRVVTTAVRSPVRPATRWIRVVSMASGRVIAGRMVVSRRASIDVPAPGGPSKRRLLSERPHQVPPCARIGGAFIRCECPHFIWEPYPGRYRSPATLPPHGPWPGDPCIRLRRRPGQAGGEDLPLRALTSGVATPGVQGPCRLMAALWRSSPPPRFRAGEPITHLGCRARPWRLTPLLCDDRRVDRR
jgi:hypothetical protein